MRRLVLAAVSAAIVAMPAICSAGPLIIATSVTSHCAVEADGTVATVLVTLNPTTHGFFAATLYYHFVASPNGVSVVRPSPSTNPNPVPLAVSAGQYALTITTTAGSGGPSSPTYSITVPQYTVQQVGSRKMCSGPLTQGNVKLEQGALIHP